MSTDDTLYIEDVRHRIADMTPNSLLLISDTIYDISIVPTTKWVGKRDFVAID